MSTLESLITDVAEHFNEVEMADMPALDDVLGPKEIMTISDSYIHMKLLYPLNTVSFTTFFSWLTAPVKYLFGSRRKLYDGRAIKEDGVNVDTVN